MVDRFAISGPVFPHQPKPQPQYFGSGNTYEYTTSLGFQPPAEHKLFNLQPVEEEYTTPALTTQINEELGKCTASKSNKKQKLWK
jgi:hypothetical protein